MGYLVKLYSNSKSPFGFIFEFFTNKEKLEESILYMLNLSTTILKSEMFGDAGFSVSVTIKNTSR